jgi:hypothetical protein
MSDQCATCTVRGDFERCLVTPCGHHENWYECELMSKYTEALAQVTRLQESVNAICVEAADLAFEVDSITASTSYGECMRVGVMQRLRAIAAQKTA